MHCGILINISYYTELYFVLIQLWTDVQARCGNVGKHNMSRRIRLFNILYVHHEIAKRSMEILDRHDVNVLQTISPGAALFYSWVMFDLTQCTVDST